MISYTLSEWKSVVRDTVVVTLNEFQHAKLKEMQESIILKRLQILRIAHHECQLSLSPEGVHTRETEFEAKFADIALMPEFRAIVESSFDADIHVNDDRINEETFQAELASLPNLNSAFNFHRQLELSGIMARALGCETWIGILDLAVAWFHCEGCKKYVRWPEVLAHMCQRPARVYETEREDWAPDCYRYDVVAVSDSHPWSSKTLRPIVPEDISSLQSIIAVCGLDADTATAAQMDALDARVTYERMPPTTLVRMSEGKMVMTWRRAVRGLHSTACCVSLIALV